MFHTIFLKTINILFTDFLPQTASINRYHLYPHNTEVSRLPDIKFSVIYAVRYLSFSKYQNCICSNYTIKWFLKPGEE